MKKALVILLALAMLFSLAACGGSKGTEPAKTDTPAAQPGAKTDAPAAPSGTKTDAPAAQPGGETKATAPKELGFYDPDFDYTQYPR